MPQARRTLAAKNTWSVPSLSHTRRREDMPFAIESSVFQQGGAIPRRFTCDAEDASPPLRWSGAPEKTRIFKLYALDAPLGDLGTPTKRDLENAMNGHVLASAELMGTYQRAGK
jgi:phosphatidylethanolamine-binding protein (PEBP) family uncharacterized protein